MAKVYRDTTINVGFGLTPTIVVGPSILVSTENEISRFLLEFPASYSSYTKSIIINFISASSIDTTEIYDLSYDSTLQSYYFLLSSRFTHGEHIKVQFRARIAIVDDTQIVVDPKILRFQLKTALETGNETILETPPLSDVTTILQGMIDAHAAVVTSTALLGHVMIDNDTIKVTPEGQLYSDHSVLIDAVSAKPDGVLKAITTETVQIYPGSFTNLCTITLNTGTIFNLGYIGLSSTDDTWFKVSFGTAVISSMMICPSMSYNQFYFPYKFIRVVGDGTKALTLQVMPMVSVAQISGEIGGGDD